MSSTDTPTTDGHDAPFATASSGSTADEGRDPADFATIDEALADIRAGRMVMVWTTRTARTKATSHGGPDGHARVDQLHGDPRPRPDLPPLTAKRCEELDLRPMVAQNSARFQTAFTQSIEARHGVTTGISAADRARTIQVAVDPECGPHDIVQPGHIFPLIAAAGGVLERAGQTEACVDLARLAGLQPAAVICEIMNDDGTMASVPDLVGYCRRHGSR